MPPVACKTTICVVLLAAMVGCRTAEMIEPALTCVEAPEHLPGLNAPQHRPVKDYDVAQAQFEQGELLPPPADPIVSDPEMMTLAELEGIALANNPTLAAASARIDAAYGRQVQAGLYPNPVIGYHATEVGNLDTAGAQGGFVSQRFITAGKLGLDQAVAGQRMEEAQFQLYAQEQRVRSDVHMRFYDALVAQRRVALTKELADIGDELVTATETLIKGRLGTDNDLLQAEIRAEESRILLDNARNEHAEAWRRLSAVVGMPTMRMAELAGELDSDLPNLDWETCYATVVGANPELGAARAHVEKTSFAVARARKEPIPDIDVFVSVRHQNITGSDIVNVQAGFPIPVFNKNQGNIHAAESEWIAANQDLQRIELELQDRLAVAFRRYSDARKQVDRYRLRIVPKAEKSLQLVTSGYEKGQVEYLTLLTAQETYYQVNLSYLDSLRELWRATAAIDGQLLGESLANRP